MVTTKDFESQTPTWCPGCGDWGINTAVKKSLVNMGYSPSDICIVFGIGCSGNMNDFLHAYAYHGLHGRALPTAVGFKLANHRMPVIVIAGDGDTYGEGGNHFLHACRGNHDITLVVHDNSVYGLTTGQVAPTALHGTRAKSTPAGMIEQSVSPLSLAITQGASFVAQSFAGNMNHMTDVLTRALSHPGFSLVNVLQPCVTFNRVNTYQYYLEKSYLLDGSYDPNDKKHAILKAEEMMEERYPLGVIYEDKRTSYHGQIASLTTDVTLKDKPKLSTLEPYLKEFI